MSEITLKKTIHNAKLIVNAIANLDTHCNEGKRFGNAPICVDVIKKKTQIPAGEWDVAIQFVHDRFQSHYKKLYP